MQANDVIFCLMLVAAIPALMAMLLRVHRREGSATRTARQLAQALEHEREARYVSLRSLRYFRLPDGTDLEPGSVFRVDPVRADSLVRLELAESTSVLPQMVRRLERGMIASFAPIAVESLQDLDVVEHGDPALDGLRGLYLADRIDLVSLELLCEHVVCGGPLDAAWDRMLLLPRRHCGAHP